MTKTMKGIKIKTVTGISIVHKLDFYILCLDSGTMGSHSIYSSHSNLNKIFSHLSECWIFYFRHELFHFIIILNHYISDL